MALKTAAPARSAGIVIFRMDGAARCLLLRAYRNWDFPKGMIEPDETPWLTARREVREETGITKIRFPWGEEYRETEPYGKGKIARYYLAMTDEFDVLLPINPELGRPEHHEFRWTECSDAQKLLPERLHSILDWACNRVSTLQPPTRF
jgi:8-oxo-dGTP pyrophosphatase MutT (NUDIX family)